MYVEWVLYAMPTDSYIPLAASDELWLPMSARCGVESYGYNSPRRWRTLSQLFL